MAPGYPTPCGTTSGIAAMTIRIALYARFSTDKQRKESCDDQFRMCERTAHAQGFMIVARFKDEGITAGTASRPGYQDLLVAARSGHFDLILAEDISRLWRNRAEYGSRSAELEDAGVHLVTCVGDDTRRDGWMIVTIKLAIAEAQRKEISYRTKRGMEGLALAGSSTGGWKPFGYGSEAEAEAVRAIFRMRARGYGYGKIAAILNAKNGIDGALGLSGIYLPPPRGGSQWGRSTVKGLLSNACYVGQAIYGKTETKGGARDSRLKRRVMRSEPIVARIDESLRLVSDELFRSAANA
jgi:site-specific DNA recombinase